MKAGLHLTLIFNDDEIRDQAMLLYEPIIVTLVGSAIEQPLQSTCQRCMLRLPHVFEQPKLQLVTPTVGLRDLTLRPDSTLAWRVADAAVHVLHTRLTTPTNCQLAPTGPCIAASHAACFSEGAAADAAAGASIPKPGHMHPPASAIARLIDVAAPRSRTTAPSHTPPAWRPAKGTSLTPSLTSYYHGSVQSALTL